MPEIAEVSCAERHPDGIKFALGGFKTIKVPNFSLKHLKLIHILLISKPFLFSKGLPGQKSGLMKIPMPMAFTRLDL